MIKVEISPRKVVFVKTEKERDGVFCTYFADNSEDFPIGQKYVRLPRNYADKLANLSVVSAAREYFRK